MMSLRCLTSRAPRRALTAERGAGATYMRTPPVPCTRCGALRRDYRITTKK